MSGPREVGLSVMGRGGGTLSVLGPGVARLSSAKTERPLPGGPRGQWDHSQDLDRGLAPPPHCPPWRGLSVPQETLLCPCSGQRQAPEGGDPSVQRWPFCPGPRTRGAAFLSWAQRVLELVFLKSQCIEFASGNGVSLSV